MSMLPLRYLSICSGIEAATVAWHHLGWQAAGFAEIDAFARAVLEHHYPDVPLHGDFTRLRAEDYGAIDLLVGGTPCQSFSIAGQRRGLDDDRGNLALEFIRLAERSRARWLVWENVPGVLSIDGGRAFGAFLGALAECGYGFAYRILDAQYFGVPQRRRRVFVVGYLGDWRPAASVLFEREGLRGDITPRRQARKGVAGTLTSCASGGGGGPGSRTDEAAAGYLQSVAPTLDARAGRSGEHSFATSGGLIAHTLRGEGFDASEDGTGRGTPLVAGTVTSKWAKGTGGPAGDECQNLIADPIAYNVTFCDANGRRKDRPDGGLYVSRADAAKTLTSGGERSTYIAFSAKDHGADADETAPTLRAMGNDASHANGGGQIAVAIPLQEIGKRTGKSTDDARIGLGIGQEGDAMYTLQAAAQHGVAIPLDLRNAGRDPEKHDSVNRQGCGIGAAGDPASTLSAAFVPGVASFKPGQSAQAHGIGYEEELAPSLEAGGGGNNKPAVMQHMAVRRLTPRECERLQGFPDDYTLVPYRGKPAADAPRYKALGNSMAVPVMRWIGERIREVEEALP
jgi:DNA (cytosine-5)-methyltransferase 1